jgi:hypothetical protein
MFFSDDDDERYLFREERETERERRSLWIEILVLMQMENTLLRAIFQTTIHLRSRLSVRPRPVAAHDVYVLVHVQMGS